MVDNQNTWQTLTASYKNTKARPMDIIVRIVGKNAIGGNIYLDPIIIGGVHKNRTEIVR
jgi:hypothetical protein